MHCFWMLKPRPFHIKSNSISNFKIFFYHDQNVGAPRERKEPLGFKMG